MTFEEAKKILEKEGYCLIKVSKGFEFSELPVMKKQEVIEATRVVNENSFAVPMTEAERIDRQERLKKEYEKNTKTLGPGEEQPKEGNPALKEAASQFNDALLDELRKKIAAYKKLHFYDTKTLKRKDEIIEELRDKNAELLGMVERMKEDVKDIDTNLNAANETNKCLNKKVVELSKIKGDLNSWISGLYFCIHHNNDNYKYKLKRLGKEISKLNSIIHDKNAVLSDVAEELRLTKIREKNLVEVSQKYMKENEELREKLKSINMNRHNERICKKQLAEKDEVIADLGNELAATKKELEEMTKLVEVVRKGSKEYCEYGIAAEKMIRKMAKVIVSDKPVSLKDFKEYRRLANGYSFNPHLFDFSEEKDKKLSLIRDDSVGAVTNQKNCSPFKDTHPTEDSPEEVELDEIRKALEKGHTVTIDYKD
jgi:DNA repair exonuclease SbcCD ATPase subunit